MKPTEDIPRKNPFKIPENYFEEVNRKIMSATAGSEPMVLKKGLYRKLRPWLAIAASVAVFTLLGYGAVKVFLPGNRNMEVPEISLQEFTETYFDDIDLSTLEESVASIIPFPEGPDVNSRELIEYLMLEDISENEIYELL
jgi:hypothetical protein